MRDMLVPEYIFMGLGVLALIVYFNHVYSFISHWGNRSNRNELFRQLIKATPTLFWGIGTICLTVELVLWEYGSLTPTGSKTYPAGEHGIIHYVNPTLHHVGWTIAGICFVGFLISGFILKSFKKPGSGNQDDRPM